MDVDRLLAGQRFDRELDKALAKCDVLIAVIGWRWMELLSDQAQRGKRDYVRDEIAAALKRDIIVIPVIIGREASMPPLPLAEDLPENIRDLVFYQKHNVTHESFSRDAAHLVAAIKAVLRDRRGPRPWRAIAAAAVGVISLVLAVALLGDWMDVMSRIRPGISQSSVGTNESPKAAILSSDAASKKPEEEARKKAEADAKAADDAVKKKAADEAARKKGADDEAARKAALAAADAARKKATDDEAARKAAEQAKFAVVTDCDRLAASPYDDDRPNGVAGTLDHTKIQLAATAACDDAMRRYPDVARFVYQAGRAALARPDYAKALELFRAAIDKGSVAAFTGLGAMYAGGFGVVQDYGEARKLFEKGAARGNSGAMDSLGVLYENGRGVTQDYAEARRWYEKAAELGNPVAMNSLGNIYANGRGVTRDYVTARKRYEQATALGYGSAMANLGWLYENGLGVAQNFAEARNWYEKGAALGNLSAMSSLGGLYENGKGVAQDYVAARKWYEKAVSPDNPKAMNDLGSLYENVRGVGDYALARWWYEHAAALGNSDSMYNLGRLYENGQGVSRNYEQARKWYEKAADSAVDDVKKKAANDAARKVAQY
jgi:TPR repeat protein